MGIVSIGSKNNNVMQYIGFDNRAKILSALASNCNGFKFTELKRHTGIGRKSLAYHLKYMKKEKLVSKEVEEGEEKKQGKYFIEPDGINELKRLTKLDGITAPYAEPVVANKISRSAVYASSISINGLTRELKPSEIDKLQNLPINEILPLSVRKSSDGAFVTLFWSKNPEK